MGLSLGYFLSQQGVQVEIFEASPTLGGLAGALVLKDGTTVDRFYHTILSSDGYLRELCAELDLTTQLRFQETKMGFYDQGEIHSMNSVLEFLRFPPLGWIDRFERSVLWEFAFRGRRVPKYTDQWFRLCEITSWNLCGVVCL